MLIAKKESVLNRVHTKGHGDLLILLDVQINARLCRIGHAMAQAATDDTLTEDAIGPPQVCIQTCMTTHCRC